MVYNANEVADAMHSFYDENGASTIGMEGATDEAGQSRNSCDI